jgi:hypothetical protein
VLTSTVNYSAKPTQHRHTPVSRTTSSSSGGGTSAWSYWWIPLVAMMGLRGVTSCHRMESRSREAPFTVPQFDRYQPPEMDRRKLQEILDQIQRSRVDAEREFPVEEVPIDATEDWMPVEEVLLRQREALDQVRFDDEQFQVEEAPATSEKPVVSNTNEETTSEVLP